MTKTFLLAAAVCITVASCTQEKPKTPRELLSERLEASVASGKVMYGHQDDLMYGHTWKITPEDTSYSRSDVYDVSGRYPAVLGLDLGEVELGGEENLDGNLFRQMRGAALAHHRRGGTVTISWHPRNPVTGGSAWDAGAEGTVKRILPSGPENIKFVEGWLKPAADFIESLVTGEGEAVPVIFRPWHEHTGSWFWWGEDLCTAEEYKALWRLTYDYMKGRGLTDRIVWAYSPSTHGPLTAEHFMERYPGDDIIDILGVDIYYEQTDYDEDVRTCMEHLRKICRNRGKLMALTETGWEGIPSDNWWCGILLPVLREYPLCYALTWRNAWDKPGHFYGPWKGAECSEDFVRFINDGRISSVK